MAVDSRGDVNAGIASCCDASIHGLVSTSDTVKDVEELDVDFLNEFDSCMQDINDQLTISRMVIASVIRGMVTDAKQEAADKIAQKQLELERLKTMVNPYLVGLNKNEPWRSFDVGKTLHSLRITLDSVREQVEDVVSSSKASLCQWQLDQECLEEVEHMVVTICVRSLKEQFEERLWDQKAQWYSNENANWIEMINNICCLRKELDAFFKSLSNPETGMLHSHSSLEISGDLSNNKSTDELHQKVSGDGEHGESVITMPENLDAAQLKHMSKEELVNFFKIEMTKMKRNHDYKFQDMTEKYFSLKRECLKGKGSSLPSRKDKEFDVQRKKIPDAIEKLDRILVENEKFPSNNSENLIILKEGFESLRLENHQLGELLSAKKMEVDQLSSQVSDAMEKMSQYSLTEENLIKKVKNLESAVEDARIEATISGDVYNCFIREAISQIKWISEDSAKKKLHGLSMDAIETERLLKLEIAEKVKLQQRMILMALADDEKEKLINDAAAALAREKEKFMMASQELDIVKDQINQQKIIISKCNEESGVLKNSLLEALEKLEQHDVERCELNLKLQIAEKERLRQRVILMASVDDEKEKLLDDAAAAWAREKEKFIVASQEIEVVKDQINQQKMIISRCNEESSVLKNNLFEASEKLEQHEAERCELNQKLDQAVQYLKESEDERCRLLNACKEKDNVISSVKANENEYRKQMESISILVQGLSKRVASFECRVAEDLKRSNRRLKKLSFESHSLIQMANILKRKELQYKKKPERRWPDLEKAETEIMEILKLVRRELSRESIKMRGQID